jgi:hypothetical protein
MYIKRMALGSYLVQQGYFTLAAIDWNTLKLIV